MIKYYCDICGSEINEQNKRPDKFISKIRNRNGLPKKELIVHLDEVDECGDKEACVCKYCMIDAINEIDDRSKEQPRSAT